jgi:hypothetical protein
MTRGRSRRSAKRKPASAWLGDSGARDQLYRRHHQLNCDRSPRLASLLGSFSNPCSTSGMIDGDWPSNSRRRSTCFPMLAGSSGSALRYWCRRSPTSRQIARLCVSSISMGLRMTELPFRCTRQISIEGPPSPVLNFKPCPCESAEPPPVPICASVSNSVSETISGFPRHAPSFVNCERRSQQLKPRRDHWFLLLALRLAGAG